MNPVNQAQMKRFIGLYGGDTYKEDDLFEVYSAFSITSGLLSESCDPFDLHLTGCEFGLDSVALFVQGTLVTNAEDAAEILSEIKNPSVDFLFFQSKTSDKFDYGHISKFFDAIEGFFNGKMKGESPQLDDLIAAKDVIYANAGGKRNPSLKAYFVSLGTYEKNHRTEGLIEDFLGNLKAKNIFDPEGVEVQMVGASALQRYYRAATSAVEVKFSFSENVVMPQNDSVEEAYIGYVPAEQLLKLVASYDESGNVVDINKSVFFDNIRDFDEDSEINQSVIDTLVRGEGKDFAFRNNGITVVAKSIHRTSNDFKIEDFQIVNGCQTSNIIFHARNHIADVSVPLRLIGSKDDNFVSSIIVGTNRQNMVREEQFWALKPFMKNFEEYCSSVSEEDRLYFERRENQFRGQAIEKVRVVVSSTLMKVVTATLLQQPNRSSRDYRRIYSDNSGRIFLDNHNVKVYYSACYLNYKLDFLWRNQKLSPDLKIFRYYLLYGVSKSVSNGKNILVMKKAEAERYANEMVALAKDEAKLKALVESIAEKIRSPIDTESLNSREKVRDAIRSDTFFSRFDAQNG